MATTAVAITEPSSTVYDRAGFAAAAAAASALLGIDTASLVPLTDQVVSTADDQGDVVVPLGSDASS